MSRAIGIDLGTSSSCVCVWRQDRAEVIPNDWGNAATPSYVSFTNKGRLFGDPAKYRASINPHDTVFNFKRLLGRKFSDPDVRSHIEQLPYEVVERDGIPFARIGYRGVIKDFTPQEMTAMILLRMKEIAESEQGSTVSQAVISIPSSFTFPQREAVRDAAKIAGLHPLRIVSEATAAAVTYLYDKGASIEEKNVVVLDLGAGGLDVSVVTIEEFILEVKATAGDPELGGLSFDERLVAHFASEFRSRYQKSVYSSPRALQKLRVACERAKRCLSSMSQVPLEIDSLLEGAGLYSILTRMRFEDLCEDLFQRVLIPIQQALQRARLDKTAINEIVMVGGSSQIPRIGAIVSSFFGGKTPYCLQSDSVVANGAATIAAMLSTSTSAEQLLLLDCVPIALGVETTGGIMTPIVRLHTSVPTKRSEVFTTISDNQPGVVIRIYEGNNARVKDNLFIGRLELWGIPPSPRGVPQIEIAFDMDAIGGVTVSAQLRGTDESTTLTLNRGRLSRDVINRMEWETRRSRAEEKQASSRRLAAQVDPESHAYYLLSLMNDDGMESRLTQGPPPYHDDQEAFFESSQREFDRRDKGLDIALPADNTNRNNTNRNTTNNSNYSSRYGMS